ncbi:TetR family transcriptional regulator C-terminal domain-containing protein, partial [Escherichia coli]|uniref:TetR family transcriptional regulator C-terminal domain-containing protein n=1 Tax=Escherichia coli TaxID=562 RepID=UPI00390831F7
VSECARGLSSGLPLSAALIDGLWLRAALSGKPLDKPLAHSLTRHFITQHLPTD